MWLGLDTNEEPLRFGERAARCNSVHLASNGTPAGKEQNFHRPAAGEALFTAEKDPKRLAPSARRLGSCLADPLRVLAAAGRRRTRTSMCSVAARHRSLCSLRLYFAATRLVRSNNGAYSLRLPAMLAALYGVLSHSVRASMRYSAVSPFHPTAATHCRCGTLDGVCKWPVPATPEQVARDDDMFGAVDGLVNPSNRLRWRAK